MNVSEILSEINSLKTSINRLKKENKELRQRLSRLEAGTNKDLRIKAKRVLGFTMSNVRGYYNAVRSINGSQIRIYIGKNIDEEVVSKKIIDYLVENMSYGHWLKNEIKTCDDLMAVRKIATAIRKADKEGT